MTPDFDRKRVLVTGGAGFIGCNLVRRLLKEDAFVRVFDNFSTGKRDNLSDLQVSDSVSARSAQSRSRQANRNRSEGAFPSRRLEVFEGDLRDFALILEATKGIEIVFHEAALPSVIRSVKAPNTTNDVNITGTLNLLEACKVNKVRRVIYASSSSIYGDSDELPKREDMIPKPMSPYAVSKLAGEHYMRVFHHLYGIETVILRYFNVYGPYQDPTSEYSGVIAKFINAFIENKPITVYGDGEQSRDFTYVDDIVEANILAANAPVSGEIFNVAGGNRHSLKQMIETLRRIFNRKRYRIIYLNPRLGDIMHSYADVHRARRELAFVKTVDLNNGLMLTIEHIRRVQ